MEGWPEEDHSDADHGTGTGTVHDAPGLVERAMRALRHHMRREGDTENDVMHKAVWVIFAGACGTASLTGVPVWPTTILSSALFFAMALWGLARREVTETYLCVAVAVFTLLFIYYDMLDGGMWRRWWPFFVMLLDVLLVIEAPRYITTCVVAAVLLWLLVMEVEYATRAFGLLDTPDSYSYDSRRQMCTCEKPPCAHHDAFTVGKNLAGSYLVFLLDFFLTRWFADTVLAEKSKMAAAVAAAEDIAGSLAGFDLDAAGRRLERSAAELPPELYSHLEELLENLASYRPYLPDELFRRKSQGGDEVPASVPGSRDGGVVALAFTDIRSSTALWESNAPAMATALAMHNEAIRAAAALFDGYEVKTIGDAFMISFHTSSDAVRFGGAAQTALGAELRWPEGLARPDMDDGLPVLGVRMGIHCGEAVAQRNALTSRYDYFGPTVNLAARVEPFGAPGAVTVTADVIADVGDALEQFMTFPYAEVRTGKGLAKPLALTALVPRAVAGIAGSVQRVAALRTEQMIKIKRLDSSTDSRASGSGMRLPVRQVFAGRRSDSASVAVVNFAPAHSAAEAWDTQRAELRLQVLHDAVEATDGQVSSVVGTLAWASWGLHVACTGHGRASVKCVVRLRRLLAGLRGAATAARPAFHAGLAAGAVAGVELALRRGRRFVTLFGPSAWVAGALCQRAEEIGRCVLVDSAGPAALKGHVRRVDGSDGAHGALAGVDVCALDLESCSEDLLPSTVECAALSFTSSDSRFPGRSISAAVD